MLTIIQPYNFRKLSAPNAWPMIDWVSFDRTNKIATFIIGTYVDAQQAETGENRLDTLGLVFSGDDYDALLAEHPDIFTAIVKNVSALAVAAYPEILKEEEK